MTPTIAHMPRGGDGRRWAAMHIERGHYLHKMPDPRTSFEVYSIGLHGRLIGALVFGRPEATRCADWYGGVDDVKARRCDVTRWQVLNLARVWVSPDYQAGGALCRPDVVPGYVDRRGMFRSTLASDALRAAMRVIGFDYLVRRPPCFLDEPYQIAWLLSYCDTRLHRGTIYAASGFERYRVNERGIETWRVRLPELTDGQDAEIRAVADVHPRSVRYRHERAQLSMYESRPYERA